jgi:hypothetical protein
MPVWRPAPIIGALIGDIGRYLLAGGLVIGLGLAMGCGPVIAAWNHGSFGKYAFIFRTGRER